MTAGWWAASVAARGLPATIRLALAAGLLLLLLALAAVTLVSGRFHAWRAGIWKDRAVAAATQAKAIAQAATQSDAGAANATATRTAIDADTTAARAETEQSVQRIKTHAPAADPAADVDRPDADILRELEAGERHYRAAADRLQRARPR